VEGDALRAHQRSATFQRMMNGILAPFLRSFVQVYLDDIIIYSKSLEQHVDHLRKVLECLRKNKLFAKPSKCMFAQSEVEFCGFLVSKKGIRTQPEGDRIIVPNSKVLPIMTLHHSNHTAGHLGIHKTYDLIARKYWFPRMRN